MLSVKTGIPVSTRQALSQEATREAAEEAGGRTGARPGRGVLSRGARRRVRAPRLWDARAGRAPGGRDRRRGSRTAPAAPERRAPAGQVASLAAEVMDCGLKSTAAASCQFRAEVKRWKCRRDGHRSVSVSSQPSGPGPQLMGNTTRTLATLPSPWTQHWVLKMCFQ